MKKITILTSILILLFSINLNAQDINFLKEELKNLQQNDEDLNHRIDRLSKQIDDIMWHQKLGDIAHIDKQYIFGPPKWKEKNPTAMGAGNPVKF